MVSREQIMASLCRSGGPCSKAPVENSQFALRTLWEEEMDQKSTPVRHDKTSVLMLFWDPDDDDLGVAKEVDTLANVLEESYRFRIFKESLHTKKSPQAQAFNHLAHFVLHEDDEKSLLIVYYAGHGWSHASNSGTIRLSGKSPCDEEEEENLSIDWKEVERTLKKTQADVFVIFDCCHAGLLCRPANRDGSRSFQYLAACGPESLTKAPGDTSFTAAMTWAFQQLAGRPGFNVNELLALVTRAPNFPDDQYPQLFGGRFEPSMEYIYIAPMPLEGASPSMPEGEYREEVAARARLYEFVDLRFFFDKSVTAEKLKVIAGELKGHHKAKVPWLRVSFVRQSSVGDWAERKWLEVIETVRERARSNPATPVSGGRVNTLPNPRMNSDGNVEPPQHAMSLEDVSDAETITPAVDENTPLIASKNATVNPASSMDTEEHVRGRGNGPAADSTFLGKSYEALSCILYKVFSCYTRRRKGL